MAGRRRGTSRVLSPLVLGIVALLGAAVGSWAGALFVSDLVTDDSPEAEVEAEAESQQPDDEPVSDTSGQGQTSAPPPEPQQPPTQDTEDTAERDFAALWEDTSSGVVQVVASGCFGTAPGSGFLINDAHVVTNAHVVRDAVDVEVMAGGTSTPAEVVGLDADHDLALLQLHAPVPGHRFTFRGTPPKVGDQVAALGFPMGASATMTQGSVSAQRRTIDGVASPVLQTDTSVNPGNSGGPLIDRTGQIVGVVTAKEFWAGPDKTAEGIGYAIPADIAEATVSRLAAAPQEVPTPECGDLPSSSAQPTPVVEDIGYTLADYVEGINLADYELAWRQLTASFQERLGGYERFVDRNETSYISDVAPHDMRQQDVRTWKVEVTYTSFQAPENGPDGETCTNWHLHYRLVQVADGWLIDGAEPAEGSGHSPCA